MSSISLLRSLLVRPEQTRTYLFASLKVAATLAFVGSVIAETVALEPGHGQHDNDRFVQLQRAACLRRTLGVALYVLFSLAEYRVTGWAHRRAEVAATP